MEKLGSIGECSRRSKSRVCGGFVTLTNTENCTVKKVGSFKAAVGEYEKRKTKIRLGKFEPKDVTGKHKNVLLRDLIENRFEVAQELKGYKIEILYLKWWLNELGDIPAEAVKFQDIQKTLVRLRKNRTKATSNRYFSALRFTFNLGSKNGRIERSPCHGIKTVHEDNEIIRWLTTEEEKKLCAVMPIEYQLAMTIVIHTGLRKRELMSLRWSDINYTSNRITI